MMQFKLSLFQFWPEYQNKLQCIPPSAEILVPREFQFPQRPNFVLTERFGYRSSGEWKNDWKITTIKTTTTRKRANSSNKQLFHFSFFFFFFALDRIFLLPCNLRPVKDPLFLVEEFERWHTTEDNTVHLLLIGPTLDPKYTQEVLLKVF